MKLKKFINQAQMKRWDFIILICLVLLSFSPWVLFARNRLTGDNVTYTAQVSINGTVIKELPLEQNTTYSYKDAHGDVNTLEIKDGRIHMKEANCGDQVCVRRGWIFQGGQTIVCLPHRMVVEVVASDGSREGSVIY
ncbi:MAG: NusG domain II-containing protein [Streptococcaceae bacterium]|jgi:hypothetical protein|nr:NusG domain II-containing protein [Streptococcaceae bacterium]